jgi:hypothetical protein
MHLKLILPELWKSTLAGHRSKRATEERRLFDADRDRFRETGMSA